MKITIEHEWETETWKLVNEFDKKVYVSTEHTDCLQIGLFDCCGCGMPEENLAYIRAGLELIADRGPDTFGPKADRGAFDKWWDEHKIATIKLHGSQAAAYFFYYWADNLELTEHGGSVPGWLTDKGNAVLELLRAWKPEQES